MQQFSGLLQQYVTTAYELICGSIYIYIYIYYLFSFVWTVFNCLLFLFRNSHIDPAKNFDLVLLILNHLTYIRKERKKIAFGAT